MPSTENAQGPSDAPANRPARDAAADNQNANQRDGGMQSTIGHGSGSSALLHGPNVALKCEFAASNRVGPAAWLALR